jgi:hypothetical protein
MCLGNYFPAFPHRQKKANTHLTKPARDTALANKQPQFAIRESVLRQGNYDIDAIARSQKEAIAVIDPFNKELRRKGSEPISYRTLNRFAKKIRALPR